MKKLASIVFFCIVSFTTQAQELKWETNVEDAAKIAIKAKKPMLLFFTGSDWCGWCIRLQNEVLKTPEFAKWAKDNVILVELDYPRRTPQIPAIQQQNAQMQQMLQVQGYPSIWFISPSKVDGKFNLGKIGMTGYVAGGPSKWLETANQILANTNTALPSVPAPSAVKKG